MIIIAAWLLLVLLIRLLLATSHDITVARVRARVLGRGGWVTAFAQAAVRPRVMGPTLLSDRGAHRSRAYILDVADALDATVPLATATAGRHRPRRKLRRRRRGAADAAAHILAGEAAGVRGRRWWRLLASRPETERSAQGSLWKAPYVQTVKFIDTFRLKWISTF